MFVAVMLLQTLGEEHTILPTKGSYVEEAVPKKFSNMTLLIVRFDCEIISIVAAGSQRIWWMFAGNSVKYVPDIHCSA